MTRFSYIALFVALVLAVANSAQTTTLTGSAFASAPSKVFDGTASTGADKTTWGATAGPLYTSAIFGPGATNSTVVAYGFGVKADQTTLYFISRVLNASLVSNGTADTTFASTIGTDAAGTATGVGIPTTINQGAVGLGSAAVAWVGTDATGCSQVYITIVTAGSATAVTKAITTQTCAHCSNSVATGAGYVNQVNNVFYDNGTYWVSYTTVKYTETYSSGTGDQACSSGTNTGYPTSASKGGASGNGIITAALSTSLQGAKASDGSLAWTAAANAYAGTAGAVTVEPSAPSISTIKASCGPSNWTNSTTFYCAYASSATALSYNTISSTGTAGTAAVIATSTPVPGSVDASKTTSTVYNTYTVAGFVRSQYQQGILLNNQADTVTNPSSAVTVASTVSTLQLYNLTSGATATAGGVTLNVSNTVSGGNYGGSGLPYAQGWLLVDNYKSAATPTYTYEYLPFYANASTNGTKTTFASGDAPTANLFIDANGALWAGAYSTDTTLTTGYLGKLVNQVYSGSSFGTLLHSFFGLIALVFAALVVF